jgi:hypothetical protein
MNEASSMSCDGKLSFSKEPASLCYYNEDRKRVVCIESTSIGSDGKIYYQLKPSFNFRPVKRVSSPEVEQ